jgi:hypothetical protein
VWKRDVNPGNGEWFRMMRDASLGLRAGDRDRDGNGLLFVGAAPPWQMESEGALVNECELPLDLS